MSIDKNHSEQFEKYLKGDMTSSEAHEFERSVLNDPFAQEALDGLENIDPNTAFDDIKQLKRQVTLPSKKGLNWMRIAAVVALLIVSSLTIWFSTNQVQIENKKELVMKEERVPEIIDSIKSDSIPLEETETLIADATPIVPRTEKVKNDKFSIIDTNELVEENESIEEAEELEPIGALQVAEVDIPNEQIEDLESVTIETALQGKAAGVKLERSKIVGSSSIDTSELEDATILKQQSLVPEIQTTSDKAIEPDAETKQSNAERRSVARSASSSSPIISGKVTDDSGEALPGVNVVIKGTTRGTTTDFDGNYSLVKIDNMELVFAFVGFESQEFQVGNTNTLDVTLSGVTELQEVVVTAFSANEAPSYSPAKPVLGNRNYNQYIEENLIYPEVAKENDIEGTIVLQVTISPSGRIGNIEIKRSLGYGCDEEAIRLVKDGPTWNSAEKDGFNVEDKVKVRVKFKLDK